MDSLPSSRLTLDGIKKMSGAIPRNVSKLEYLETLSYVAIT